MTDDKINTGERTGLAARMRQAMKRWDGLFTMPEIAAALGVPPGAPRKRVAQARKDFVARGEITAEGHRRYRYVHGWRPACRHKDPVQAHTVYKAMHVSGRFTTADLMRRTGARHLQGVHRHCRRLVAEGYIRKDGRTGRSDVYRVVDRDRFRRELLD